MFALAEVATCRVGEPVAGCGGKNQVAAMPLLTINIY